MSKVSETVKNIYETAELAERRNFINSVFPLFKIILTVIFNIAVVSVGKYDLAKQFLFFAYIFVLFTICDIKILYVLKKLKLFVVFIVLAGIANVFFDRNCISFMGVINLNGGIISAATLIIKCFLCLASSFFLIASTTVEDICFGLKKAHIPKIFVTLFLITYRYVFLLLKEVENTYSAYILKAPNRKGIDFKVWGSLIGHILLKSAERAEEVYESMVMRGFSGEFFMLKDRKIGLSDFVFFFICAAIILIIKFI